MRRIRYNISSREVNGTTYWTVGWTENRKRSRRSFTSRKEADLFIGRQKAAEDAPGWFRRLPAEVQADAVVSARRAADAGVRLSDALDAYLTTRAKKVVPYREAVMAHIENLRDARRSKLYITGTRQDLQALPFDGDVDKVTERMLADHLGQWSGATRNSKLRRFRVFLNWAMRSGYTGVNVAAGISLQKESRDTRIFTVEESRKIMKAAVDLGVARFFGIGFYAGLRPWEIMRLEDRDVTKKHIVVRSTASKTGKRRVVPVPEVLVGYLNSGTISNVTGMKRARAQIKEATGVEWIQDGMRHSFASYHLALHGDAGKTATLLGDDVGTVHRHYVALSSRRQASTYFSVCPD